MAPTRILLVDDNRDGAESLSMLLGLLGADVRVAHDGLEALAAFPAFQPALVLLDLGMPGMDGYEVARTLRARWPDQRPVLAALTGWGQDEDRRRTREAGFDYHLVKPAELDALQELLASVAEATLSDIQTPPARQPPLTPLPVRAHPAAFARGGARRADDSGDLYTQPRGPADLG